MNLELKQKYKKGNYVYHGQLGSKLIVKKWSDFTAKQLDTFIKNNSKADIDKYFQPVKEQHEQAQEKEKSTDEAAG